MSILGVNFALTESFIGNYWSLKYFSFLYRKKREFTSVAAVPDPYFSVDRFLTLARVYLNFIWLRLDAIEALDTFYRIVRASQQKNLCKNCCRQWNIYEIFHTYTTAFDYIDTDGESLHPHFKKKPKIFLIQKNVWLFEFLTSHTST